MRALLGIYYIKKTCANMETTCMMYSYATLVQVYSFSKAAEA
jgi:hypothetical protein